MESFSPSPLLKLRAYNHYSFDLVHSFAVRFNYSWNVCWMRMDGSSDGYLVVCSYTIAVLDLISAVLFASISGMLYAQHVSHVALVWGSAK